MVETWLTFWNVKMTEISSELEDSALIKVIWSSCSDCSEKLDSTSSFSDNREECWRYCMRRTTLADLLGQFRAKWPRFLQMKQQLYFFFHDWETSFFFSEITKRFFGGWFLVEVFLKMFFLFGWANTLLFVFTLYLEMGFFTSFSKGFFCLPWGLWIIWKIFPKEISVMLRLVVVSFLWRSGCNS